MDTLKELGIQRWRLRATHHDEIIAEQSAEYEISEPAIQSKAVSATKVQPSISHSGPRPSENSVTEDVNDSKQQVQELESTGSVAFPAAKQYSWQSLSEQLGAESNCASCLNTNPVLGDGSINADWMFVIDAPSVCDVDDQHLLSGREGKLFDAILRAVGLAREDVYLSSIFKCPPNSDISLAAQCGDLIHHQIKLIQPKVILTMGEFSAQSLLRANEELDKLRGSEKNYPGGSSAVVCSFSLAQILSNPSLKAQVWQDVKMCHAILH